VLANGYLQEQAPWTTIKSNPARAAVTTRTGLNLLHICATVSWSIIPTLASRVLAAFAGPTCPSWPTAPAARYLESRQGEPILRIEPLVDKLSEAGIAHLQTWFSGNELVGDGA
jgi:methionyl-tRNA synthetase